MRHRVRRPQVIAVAALLLAGAAAGCSDSSSSSTEQTAGAPASTVASTSPDAPATEVPAALAFQAPLVGGGEFDGAAYAGRPVAFWFWAPT